MISMEFWVIVNDIAAVCVCVCVFTSKSLHDNIVRL